MTIQGEIVTESPGSEKDDAPGSNDNLVNENGNSEHYKKNSHADNSTDSDKQDEDNNSRCASSAMANKSSCSSSSSPNTLFTLHIDSLIDKILSFSSADNLSPVNNSGESTPQYLSFCTSSQLKHQSTDSIKDRELEGKIPTLSEQDKLKRKMLMSHLNDMQTSSSMSSINANPSLGSNALNYKRQTQIINVSSAIKKMYSKFNRMHLTWESDTRTVIIITKIYDRDNIIKCGHIARWLLLLNVRTCVEDVVAKSKDFNMEEIIAMMELNNIPLSPPEECPLILWNYEFCKNNPTLPDVVVTLGGDGTVLHSGWLFNEYCPPIISFDLGSLGFLTMFPYEFFISSILSLLKFKKSRAYNILKKDPISRNLLQGQHTNHSQAETEVTDTVINERSLNSRTEYSIIFRMRLISVECKKHELEKIIPYIKYCKKSNFSQSYTQSHENKDYGLPFDINLLEGSPTNILNDVVIDRGAMPFVCEVEIYVDEVFLTLIRADGLVLSTPTGSTAYSLSAGGPLLHPSLSAIIITPICPHTVSFRPIILPATATIRICVPDRSRTDCWACFDGKNKVCIERGNSVIISASTQPLPTINRFGITADWFRKIENCLGWNRYYPKNYRPANFVKSEPAAEDTTEEQITV